MGETNDYATRVSRIVIRLPRLLTEADDYSWVPLGDVLLAILQPDKSELAWPEGKEPDRLDTLLRVPELLDRIESFAATWHTASGHKGLLRDCTWSTCLGLLTGSITRGDQLDLAELPRPVRAPEYHDERDDMRDAGRPVR